MKLFGRDMTTTYKSAEVSFSKILDLYESWLYNVSILIF